MLESAIFALAFAAALGSALAAGIFFAFSSFVMTALAQVALASGIAAMNAINVAVLNRGFMTVFMGTTAISAALMAGAYVWFDDIEGKLLLAASAIYIVGCFGVTLVCNVPLNNRLAAFTTLTPPSIEFWARYLKEWTFWNHVRTGAALVAAILFIVTLITRSAG